MRAPLLPITTGTRASLNGPKVDQCLSNRRRQQYGSVPIERDNGTTVRRRLPSTTDAPRWDALPPTRRRGLSAPTDQDRGTRVGFVRSFRRPSTAARLSIILLQQLRIAGCLVTATRFPSRPGDVPSHELDLR
jgi:hypothetical protein